MSQLSFADVFNLARETADNRPVIQAGQQIAETVPTVHRMMSEQYSRGRFIRVFKDTGRHLGRWEVFSDFLSLAASELDMARIRTPESMEHCRKICARYEATDIANMQEMFCLMVCVRREGIATVSDPACGAAGMLIAYAECLLEADINPSMHMFGSCIDIDPVAADMAFIQLSLLGIAAEVVTGNTLTMQIRRVRYTPVFYLNDFEKRLADLRRFRAMRDFMRGIQEAA
ncbi:MAG: N-6 DNA methylase [Klebsiella pneumoniae]|nr:N-6 DNA methylase [Klebsiella pneumoniae]